MNRPDRVRGAAAVVAALALPLLLAALPAAARKPGQEVITRETYRQRCLLCHKVPPYGIAPEIVAGLSVGTGRTAQEIMPNTSCWRRCVKCWPSRPPQVPAK